MGRIIGRGNLFSKVVANGGISGVIAVQGDIGASSTLLSTTNPTRVGGIATDYSAGSGQVFALGRFIGDLNLLGGMTGQGKVAVRGSILGNVTINNGLAPGAALISGGTIGDPTLGTSLAVTSNQGIIAAKGVITLKYNTPTGPGYYSSNASAVPGGLDALAIDAIFADADNKPLAGLDLVSLGDFGGLTDILDDIALLHVSLITGHLSDKAGG